MKKRVFRERYELKRDEDNTVFEIDITKDPMVRKVEPKKTTKKKESK